MARGRVGRWGGAGGRLAFPEMGKHPAAGGGLPGKVRRVSKRSKAKQIFATCKTDQE